MNPVPRDHQLLFDLLTGFAPGWENATPRSWFMDKMLSMGWAPVMKDVDREMRKMFEELMTVYRLPVGACLKGWFYCESARDFIVARQVLHSKMYAMNEKLKIIREVECKVRGLVDPSKVIDPDAMTAPL